MSRKTTFLHGALILSIAGALSKIMGAIYRIPIARFLGAEGIGLYQMAYPIYVAILSLSTAGVPVAISVLIARKSVQGYNGDERKLIKASLLILLGFGLALALLVMWAAKPIAVYVLHEPRAHYPILAVAPAIFLSCVMAVFRGFFQGQQTMMPTAVSQVTEQLFRVSAVLILAFLLAPKGLEYAVSGATFGAVVGGLAGLAVLIVYYLRFLHKHAGENLNYSGESVRQMATDMVMLAIPVSLGAVVLPLVQMLDAIIVPGRLAFLGYAASEVTALYGQLAGMAAVIISLPSIFTIAISSSLVPAVSEATASDNYSLINSRINSGLQAGMLISFPAATGLFVLAYPICDLLYKAPEAGIALTPLAFSAIALAAFQLSSAGLQGTGHPQIAMHHLIVIGIFKVIFNYFLTAIPSMHIQGAALGTVLAFSIGSLLNLRSLKNLTGIHYEYRRMLKLALICVCMGLLTYIGYHLLLSTCGGVFLPTVGAVIIGVMVFGVLLWLTKELDWDLIRSFLKA